MRRLLPFALFAALSGIAMAQAPVITFPTQPSGCKAGSTIAFTATGSGITWSVTGGGSINSSTGIYTCPTVHPPNQSRGCQIMPTASAPNQRIDSLPVNPHSSNWTSRPINYGPTQPTYHSLKPTIGSGLTYYDNPVTNSTPTQVMDGYINGPFNGTSQPMPTPPNVRAQAGWSGQTNDGRDYHLLRTNTDTCSSIEQYQIWQDFSSIVFTAGNPTLVSFSSDQIYPSANPMSVWVANAPAGCWSAINGNYRNATVIDRTHISIPVDTSLCGVPSPQPNMCPVGSCTSLRQKINTDALGVFKVDSTVTPFGSNAGNTSITGYSLKLEEFYGAVAKCTAASNCSTADLGHGFLNTLSNVDLASYYVWPASSWAGGVGGGYTVSGGTWNGSVTVFTSTSSLATIQPCPDGTYTVGCTFGILFLGAENTTTGQFPASFTGSWAALNNSSPFDSTVRTATIIDATHFSIPDNTNGFGSQTPSTAHFYFDFIPYGGTFRLPAAFNNNLVCTAAQTWTNYCLVYLNTLKHYGTTMQDGTLPSSNWEVGSVGSEFSNADMVAAGSAITTYFQTHPWDAVIEAVDTSSIQLNPGTPTDMATTTGRTTVTATNISGSASLDVYPQGTAVDAFPEYVAVTTGSTYQINPWVTGNTNTGFTCSMSPPITGASVTSACLFTAPPLGTSYTGAVPQTIVTITSSADSNAVGYVTIDILPTSSDGAIRLVSSGNQLPGSGWSTIYTDSFGFVWHGTSSQTAHDLAIDAYSSFDNAGQIASWTSPPIDPNLYWSVYQTGKDDTLTRIALPNGTYTVKLYGSSQPFTYTANTSAFDWELNGVVVANFQDPWVLAGNVHNAGWSLTATATVSNGILESGIRNRLSAGAISPYGTLVGALEIVKTQSIFGQGAYLSRGTIVR